MKQIVTAVVCLSCVTWGAVVPQAAPPVPAGAAPERTINCESHNYRYQYCRVDTDSRVRLERQLSAFCRCVYGDTWGYDRRSVWVDRGCQAEFRVGRDGGGDGNHFDVIFSGLWVTPARALVVNFTEATSIEAVHVVAGTPLAAAMKAREDFNRPDVRIVVYAGTIQEGLAARLFPGAQVVKVEGDADPIAPLLEGKAHAALLTTPTPGLVVRSAPGQLFLPAGSTLQTTATAAALRKGDPDFLNYVNSWLAFQRQSGFIEERTGYWFRSAEWLRKM